jgi:DNA primase catalytic core
LLAAKYYKAQLKQNDRAIDYLKRRGLSGEIAAKYGLGYAPDEWQGLQSVASDYDKSTWVDAGLVIDKSAEGESKGRRYDRFRDRVMFPIRSTKGEIIGFGGRIIDQGEPKYLNSPETPLFNKGQELYGLGEARVAIRAAGYALVTEGYMDVVALAQLGFPQAVATLGTAVGAAHVQKLFRYTDHIVFSFDGDAAGRKAAWRALEASLALVTDTRRASFLFLPAEHDPDSFVRQEGTQAFEHAVANAMPLSKFLLKTLHERHDTSNAEGRAALLHDAKPMLQSIQARMLSLQITKGLAQVAQISPAEVEQFLEVGRLSGELGRAGKGAASLGGGMKAQMDGSLSKATGKLSKDDWAAQQSERKTGIRKSSGTLAPQASRAQLLGHILLHAPEQFATCEDWLNDWRNDLKRTTVDEQTLVFLCDELAFVRAANPVLTEAALAGHIASQAESGVGSGLNEWLRATMNQAIAPSSGDAARLAAGIREAQLHTLTQQAAAMAGQSPQALQTYKDLAAAHTIAKAASVAQTLDSTVQNSG